jgi:hypothetical protein
MKAEALTGLWEFVGLWDEVRGAPVMPRVISATRLSGNFCSSTPPAPSSSRSTHETKLFISMPRRGAYSVPRLTARRCTGPEPAATPITGFAGMLPSLVYPEYGGSGVTKSIGSWMRSAAIQGLVFPSARSNVEIEVDQQGAHF